MSGSIRDIPKKRGRPPAGGRQPGVMVRLPPDQLALLDRWILDQGDAISRPEAMRRLMMDALVRAGVG